MSAIKITTDEDAILAAVNSYARITHHVSFALSRSAGQGAYSRVGNMCCLTSTLSRLLKQNGIKLAVHCDVVRGRQFRHREIKSRFGESYVHFSLGGVSYCDDAAAKAFYSHQRKEDNASIVGAIDRHGLDAGIERKRKLMGIR